MSDVVKRFFHTALEKIDMDAKKGVFIHSAENPDDIIKACKDLIQSCISGGKIEAAVPDDKYGGIKLYLNRDEVVQKFLSRRFLLKENGETLATIHPLTTQLIVRDAKILIEEEKFEKFMLFILDNLDIKYHQILKISNIPFSEHHPDVLTTDLRIILDIPEIEDLYVFKDVGLPKDLEIPTGTGNEMISLNFYCPTCKKGGHTSWSCPKRIGSEVALNSSPEKPSNAEAPHTPKSRNSIPSHKKENTKEVNTPEVTLPPEKMDVSKFEGKVGKEEVRYYNIFYPNTPGSSNKKVGVSSSSTMKRSLFHKDDQKNESNSKKARTSLINNGQEQSEEISKNGNSENDIYVIQPSASTKKVQHLNPTSERFEIYNVNSGGISPNPGPSSLQVFSVSIPPRIKEMWIPLCGFQSIEQFEPFLDHAKKRTNLRKLAILYDVNFDELKQHLNHLRKAYYNEKKSGNNEVCKEEKEFMDWFGGLVDRMN
ncbi:uncharacterized protein LOC129984766 [Argiope bruennichi]|uniref:uncharacterized protein LOC129984766 n=1 Tax=Argiope bruennichi TaxID=94029 RepID=UPI002494747C|nr:uncharacterized protein LOC129984766 [Argiope bruennichi]